MITSNHDDVSENEIAFFEKLLSNEIHKLPQTYLELLKVHNEVLKIPL